VPLSEDLEAHAADDSAPAGASTLTLFGPYLQADESEPATAVSSEEGVALEPPEQALSLEPGPAEVAAFAASADLAALDEGAFAEPAELTDALESGAPVSEAEMVVAPPAPSGGVPEEVFATLVSAQVPGADADALLPLGVDFELETDLAADGAEEASLFLGEDDSSLEEIDTKLDLARAYIDMGDSDGARGILSEVLSEGNDTQRGEAEDLLTRLA
jgi:pilus assembly protein FimV